MIRVVVEVRELRSWRRVDHLFSRFHGISETLYNDYSSTVIIIFFLRVPLDIRPTSPSVRHRRRCRRRRCRRCRRRLRPWPPRG